MALPFAAMTYSEGRPADKGKRGAATFAACLATCRRDFLPAALIGDQPRTLGVVAGTGQWPAPAHEPGEAQTFTSPGRTAGDPAAPLR
jgi:hypothetical protein